MKILTFDIEDWFHILDVPKVNQICNWDAYESRIHKNVDRLLASVEKYNHSATFFCLGWIATRYPNIIRKISELGYEIASHGHMHQLVYEQTPNQFRNDVDRSVKSLEDIIGKKIKGFRAPGFSITSGMPWAFEALLELGIEYDSSVFPALRGHGGFARFGTARPAWIESSSGRIKEFPINLSRLLWKSIVFSGGGYFRILPYWMIERLTKKSDYVMTYFHPRDFDPCQPRLKLPIGRHFKSYFGLKSSHAKLERWLENYHFVDVEHANANIDWSSAPSVRV